MAALVTVLGALIAVFAGLPDAAVLVAPWVVLLAVGLPRRPLESTRATIEVAAERVLVGDDVEVIISLTGAAGSVGATCLPSAGFWPRGEVGGRRPSARTEDVVVAGRAKMSCLLEAVEWGTHDVGRVELEVTHPYGLFREDGSVTQPTTVRVHPEPIALRNLLAPRLVRRVIGAHGSRAIGRGVEYADIRPFAAGDSLRDINWRASARSRELWVSQRHPSRATDVILLLDSFVESGHDVRTVVGLAIEAAVGLAESHLAVSDRVGLVELGGALRWVSPGTGRLQLQRLTDALLATGLYAYASERDLRVIPPRVLPPRSFVVALSPLLDDRFINALFVLTGRGHDVAVIECAWMSPDPEAAVADEPAGLALRLWDAERQMVRDRLADHGVAVVGWPKGAHLDVVLDELTRHRHRTVRSGRR